VILLKYDKTNYNRLYAGELENWKLQSKELETWDLYTEVDKWGIIGIEADENT